LILVRLYIRSTRLLYRYELDLRRTLITIIQCCLTLSRRRHCPLIILSNNLFPVATFRFILSMSVHLSIIVPPVHNLLAQLSLLVLHIDWRHRRRISGNAQSFSLRRLLLNMEFNLLLLLWLAIKIRSFLQVLLLNLLRTCEFYYLFETC
jgi:hypothetical protein